MATFAKLDITNTVITTIKVGNDVMTSDGPLGENDKHVDGEKYCHDLLGGNWKQSSFSNSFRKRAASIGGSYDPVNDVFIGKQPYLSWNLDSNFEWQPPIARPTENNNYKWNEQTLSWDLIEVI
jgi:hypothetical protein